MKPVSNITFENTLKRNRTIIKDGVDTHIMFIRPVGFTSPEVPFDVEITFNSKPKNIVLENKIDDTRIDKSYVFLLEEKMYYYDQKQNADRKTFPGNLTFPIWKFGFKYYYTSHAFVNFTIKYTIDEKDLSYSFFVQNTKEWQVGDYMLSNKERGIK